MAPKDLMRITGIDQPPIHQPWINRSQNTIQTVSDQPLIDARREIRHATNLRDRPPATRKPHAPAVCWDCRVVR